MSSAKEFFFWVGFPPCASNFELKNKLKSPAITSCFVRLISHLVNSSNKLLNTSICSFSVLALCKFIKMYSEWLIEMTFLICLLFLMINVPVQSKLSRYHKKLTFREKKTEHLRSSFHFCSTLLSEWISCGNNTPVDPV